MLSIDCWFTSSAASNDQSCQKATHDNVTVIEPTPDQPEAATYTALDPTTLNIQTVYQPLSQAAPRNVQNVAYVNVTLDKLHGRVQLHDSSRD